MFSTQYQALKHSIRCSHTAFGRGFAAAVLLLNLGPWAGATPAAETGAGGLQLHVPAPDWRDQIIYFVVTDRYADGNPANNDQGAHEYDPRDNGKYSGGDLQGLQQRLDYIQGLGATAVWITPPVANQWWDPMSGSTGYHGYWASDFSSVDAHLGSLADYQRLSDALHRRGMYLVQDIVVNHTGNFFTYTGPWNPARPQQNFHPNRGAVPATPTQWPFSLNDVRRAADRRAAIYHWTPSITNYRDPHQVFDFQLADLDDLNTENPAVRRALRQSYGQWIRRVGVDAFRVDTVFYVPPAFFRDFMDSPDPAAPGMTRVARSVGQGAAFFAFGEGFGIDRPGSTEQEQHIERYMRAPGGQARLPGMLNFPLYGAINDVVARGQPTAQLAFRIGAMMRLHPRIHWMPSFVDNHDVDRFLSYGSEAALKQALLLMFTLPGIPVITYGTEQGFTLQRGAMFAGGYGANGRDHFDTQAPLYRVLRELAALRRGNPLFSRGRPQMLQASAAGPGVLAYRMRNGADEALVLLNTADTPSLADHVPSGWPVGTQPEVLFTLGKVPAARVDAQGHLSLVLPPRGAVVWRAATATTAHATGSEADRATAPRINTAPTRPVAQSLLALRGIAAPAAKLALVVDGRLPPAAQVQADAQGRWRVELPTGDWIDAAVQHRVVVWDDARQQASDALLLRAAPRWQLAADVPGRTRGEARGPQGRYTPPSGDAWPDLAPLTLRRTRVYTSGEALRIDLDMGRISTLWNPPNGFDHVAVTLYLQVPGLEPTLAQMPLQHTALPDGMRWNRRLRITGWTNVLLSAQGAGETAEGTPVTPGAQVAVDARARRIHITLPASALGNPATLAGTRLLVTTWDYDNGYRPLAPQAGPGSFGGGQADEPRVMDSTPVIELGKRAGAAAH